jgi:hypothetical protein
MKPLAQSLSFAVILMVVCMASGGCGGSTPALQNPPPPSPLPPPSITSKSPTGMIAVVTINAPVTVTVNGTNVQKGATVNWNGQASAATFVNDTQLITQFPSAGINIPSTFVVYKVTVVNPSGDVSNAVDFTFQIFI